jgi:3-methyladenine DNA glycosylase/8-oxoguanine DNA glycosylase
VAAANAEQSQLWREAEEQLRLDPRLGPVLRRVGACRLVPERPTSLFAALLRSIVYQQLHARAAAAIHQRVLALLSAPEYPKPEAVARLSDEALRAAGLSRGKLLAIRDLVARALAGELPEFTDAQVLGDAELVERLTVVRGIGPWTVQMLQIFYLGRPDIWPVGDFGVRSGVQKLWHKRVLPDEKFMERVGRAWQPWRSVASWYLWRSHELPPEAG